MAKALHLHSNSTKIFPETLGMALRVAYLSLHRRFNYDLEADCGITADQFVALNILAEREGISQREMASALASDPSTVSALVRRLEGRGLLRRPVDRSDARARGLSLTAVGRRLQRKAWRRSAALHATLWGCCRTAAEEEVMHSVLGRIAAAMGGGSPRAPRGRARS
jgi:DNA-binding MarR family transcriptional regulator